MVVDWFNVRLIHKSISKGSRVWYQFDSVYCLWWWAGLSVLILVTMKSSQWQFYKWHVIRLALQIKLDTSQLYSLIQKEIHPLSCVEQLVVTHGLWSVNKLKSWTINQILFFFEIYSRLTHTNPIALTVFLGWNQNKNLSTCGQSLRQFSLLSFRDKFGFVFGLTSEGDNFDIQNNFLRFIVKTSWIGFHPRSRCFTN